MAIRGSTSDAVARSSGLEPPSDGEVPASRRASRPRKRCSARQCSRTRLFAMPSSHALTGPRQGSKLCRRLNAVAKVSAVRSSANGVPTRRAIKRCTKAKFASKQCSKSASPSTGVHSQVPAWRRLGPPTSNDCQIATDSFPVTMSKLHRPVKVGPGPTLSDCRRSVASKAPRKRERWNSRAVHFLDEHAPLAVDGGLPHTRDV